ncbi:MAG: hypothetical protein J6P03_01670 [Opitutales bacterium]|nr:hypothetical protein [Opitutales bacterium]
MRLLFSILCLAVMAGGVSACRVEDFYDSNSNFLDRQMFDSPDHSSYFDSENVKIRKEYEKKRKENSEGRPEMDVYF